MKRSKSEDAQKEAQDRLLSEAASALLSLFTDYRPAAVRDFMSALLEEEDIEVLSVDAIEGILQQGVNPTRQTAQTLILGQPVRYEQYMSKEPFDLDQLQLLDQEFLDLCALGKGKDRIITILCNYDPMNSNDPVYELESEVKADTGFSQRIFLLNAPLLRTMDTPLGRIVSDYFESDPDKMHTESLARLARQAKQRLKLSEMEED